MKVLHICRRYRNVGGMERYLRDLCRLQVAGGHVPVVLYDEESVENFCLTGVTTVCVPGVATWLPERNEAAWEALRAAHDRIRPDIIHLHDLGNPSITARVQSLAPTLSYVQTCGYYCMGARFFPRSRRPCDRPFGPACLALAAGAGCASRRPGALVAGYWRVSRELDGLRACRRIMVSSEYMREMLVTNGVERERVRVVPSFTPDPGEPAPLPPGPRLLFAGRLVTGKGTELLIAAMPLLPGAELEVVGDGGQRCAAEALARRLGVADRVRFVGWRGVAEMEAHYAQARVVVVPSVWPEPFGLVGVEAMARGRPVVGIDRGGVRDWLVHGETGYRCSADASSLAEAIRRLLDAPETAAKMGAGGRERWRALYSPAAHDRMLHEAYAWSRGGHMESLHASIPSIRERSEP
jgi:glycosyltransferase involved in cell wall biosynthesis